ncbi:MAG: MipA/OmpV family protein [Xanthomonadaceae bacterium]|nr:MipA/OmpV family protein [Xanthomonadaceae bacterium]
MHRVLLSTCLLACVLCSPPGMADTATPSLAFGAGAQRMPSWAGANDDRSEPVPYLYFKWPGHGSFSTLDGLQVELLHGPILHGGIYGNYQWGRLRDDLGVLGGKIASLPPRINMGGYLEWQLGESLDAGVDLSHDINGAGAYLDLYAEWDLPSTGLLEHSIALRWQAMNAPAMTRFFGIRPSEAVALGVPAWRPGAGSQLASLEYDLFVPTSRHTGVALALVYGRLLGQAAASPLVTRFGSATQLSESLAFVYHL